MGILDNDTIKQLVADLEKRVSEHILEPNNLEFLKKLLSKAESEDEAISICKLGTTFYKTGLVFDKKMEVPSDGIKIFKKNNELSFDNGGIKNKLIIGDNYDALINLLIEYRNSIDAIYIDPPYGSNSMGEFAFTNYENQINRDNLLSMLQPRLILAKQLLSDGGVIFCSIDDKNQAYVKCLFDEIFGEQSFICCMPRKCRGSATTKSDRELQVLHDYVLMYCKDYASCEFVKRIKGEKKYPYSDAKGNFYAVPLQDNGPGGTRTARPNLYYPIYYSETKDDFSLDKIDNTYKEYLPKMHKNDDGRWMWSKKKFEQDKNYLSIIDDTVKIKHYYNPDEDQNQYEQFKTWLDSFPNSSGTKMVNSIIGKGLFDNPKPVELISWLLNIATKENSVVLDFFAGSGTTAHALLENNKDKNMQFILVQLDENLDHALTKATESAANTIKHQIEFLDSLNRPHLLSEITCERLRRIMTGKTFKGDSHFDWIEKNEKYGNSLDVYYLKELSVYDQNLFEEIDETLYGIKKLDTIQEKVDWVCRNFEKAARRLQDVTRS